MLLIERWGGIPIVPFASLRSDVSVVLVSNVLWRILI